MGIFDSFFKSNKSTVTQQPMMTPEQLKAMQMLSSLGLTGGFGDINLGEAYSGSLGDFNQTQTEGLSGNKLYDLLNSASPAGYDTARNTLTGLANTKFNPDDPSSGFAAYKRQVERATEDSNNVLNREAAITGDRFSNSILRNKQDLAAQQSDLLGTKLADLFNTAQNRALSASSALGNLETQAQNSNLGRIEAGFNLGGLQRLLNTAKAQADYQEFNRQRDEKLSRIGISQNLFGTQVPYGIMSSTVKTPSPFSELLNSALKAGGQAALSAATGGISNLFSGGIKNLFPSIA